MTGDSEKSWWRRTRLLAIVVVGLGAGLSLTVMLSAQALDVGSVGGIPNGVLAVTLLVPLVVVLLIFWSAERQSRLDRTLGHFED